MAAKGKFHIPSLNEMELAEEEKTPVASLFEMRKAKQSLPKTTDKPASHCSAVSTSASTKGRGSTSATAVQGNPRPAHHTSLGGSSASANQMTTGSGIHGEAKPATAVGAATSKSCHEVIKATAGTSTEPSAPPRPGNKSVSITVNSRQRGNPILKFVRSVPWEFGDIVPDYELGQTTCALFLSLRYHALNPNYIHQRLKQLAHSYELRVLLVQVDVKDPHHSLKELAKMCILADCTLILAFSAEEAGRYLETYKAFENKPPDLIKERTDSNFLAQVTDTLTSVKKVNKTDASTLLSTFGTMADVFKASEEDLSLCSGFGPQKAHRLHEVLHEPFLKKKKAKVDTASQKKVSAATGKEATASTLTGTADTSPIKPYLSKPADGHSPRHRIAHRPKTTANS